MKPSKITALLALAALLLSSLPFGHLSAQTGEIDLEDIDALVSIPISDIGGSFAREDIIDFLQKGYLKGYEDETFRPNNPITRAEYLSVVMKAFAITVNASLTGSTFADVSVTWMVPYVEKAKEFNIRGQRKDGRDYFRPNDPITRAEAVAMLFRIKRITLAEVTVSSFSDVTVEWMIKYIEKAKSLGIASGQYIGGQLRFRPDDSITRAESVKIIAKMRLQK